MSSSEEVVGLSWASVASMVLLMGLLLWLLWSLVTDGNVGEIRAEDVEDEVELDAFVGSGMGQQHAWQHGNGNQWGRDSGMGTGGTWEGLRRRGEGGGARLGRVNDTLEEEEHAEELNERERPQLRIGVVGNSSTPIKDEEYVHTELRAYFETAVERMGHSHEVVVVTGLTALGVPRIAVEEARALGLRTVGYACARASEYELNPVDEEHIIGNEWGDESASFLMGLDTLIKIGGGQQSKREYAMFHGPKLDIPDAGAEQEEQEQVQAAHKPKESLFGAILSKMVSVS